ncbi:hypothetical protein CYLTODRAFT_416922 [Cylindrobasidium torrendii FP15055 ss-10]|uniref:Uncharacterized protein n=1 Tax=Cylindrobasidium torrendii FP15055 ss-10 TaxID=1314674 RepID=A0A0D7BTP1_9AGAR|nr:hypothetical protein CYLTODRAFT_416922 [Cylindrobasidium torrendii FP15055 ss-10]
MSLSGLQLPAVQSLASISVPFSRPQTPGIPTQFGYVGLGAMGAPIARNLCKKLQDAGPGHHDSLLVWNRTTAKSKKFVDDIGTGNARVASDVAQVARECDVVFTCLGTDEAVESVYLDMIAAIKDDSSKHRIFVDMSTIYPALAGNLDDLVSTVPHAHFVACPVVGPPAVAAKGEVLIIMSGNYRSKKEVAHLLVPGIGRKIVDLGEDIQKAHTYKLIANSMILGTLEILGEAYTLGEKSGIGGDNVHRLVQEIFPAPGMLAYSDKMNNDAFDGTKGFDIEGGIKDAQHIRRLTNECNSPMPFVDVAHQRLVTARAVYNSHKIQGKETWESLDWSGIVAGSRVAAGLEAFSSGKAGRAQVEVDDS